MYLNSINKEDDTIDVEMESLILSNKENYILISEDWGFETLMPKLSFLTINTESFYYLIESEHVSTYKISRYLANLHFIGCNIDADYIYDQYVSRSIKHNNSYDNCLITIERNNLIFQEVLEAGNKVLTKQFNIDAADIISVTNMFTFLLKNMDSQIAKQLIALSLLSYRNDLLTNCLKNAYTAVFPILY